MTDAAQSERDRHLTRHHPDDPDRNRVRRDVLPAAHEEVAILRLTDVDAADISSDALAVAQRNVADYGMQDRINLIRSDLWSNLTEKTYDLIISNPPYVTAMSMAELPDEYRHEPELALAGGDDGLDAVRAIIDRAAPFLKPHGLLLVEVGHNRVATEAAYPRLPFTWLNTGTEDDSVFLLQREDLVATR